ncbi:MAG: phage head closure protein [Paenacidovorax caeni]
MQAGRLDQRVTVEQFTTTTDSWGQPVEKWAPMFTCWAAVEPLTGREFIAAQAAQSEVTARIRMRFRPWMTAQDRVIHNGTIYSIESVIDQRSQGRELVLMCKGDGVIVVFRTFYALAPNSQPHAVATHSNKYKLAMCFQTLAAFAT